MADDIAIHFGLDVPRREKPEPSSWIYEPIKVSPVDMPPGLEDFKTNMPVYNPVIWLQYKKMSPEAKDPVVKGRCIQLPCIKLEDYAPGTKVLYTGLSFLIPGDVEIDLVAGKDVYKSRLMLPQGYIPLTEGYTGEVIVPMYQLSEGSIRMDSRLLQLVVHTTQEVKLQEVKEDLQKQASTGNLELAMESCKVNYNVKQTSL